jgi:hypothetical protein
VQTVASMDQGLLVNNITVARMAKTFGLAVVLSTVNIANGQGPTIPELKAHSQAALRPRRATSTFVVVA